jgi:hypothetical protein
MTIAACDDGLDWREIMWKTGWCLHLEFSGHHVRAPTQRRQPVFPTHHPRRAQTKDGAVAPPRERGAHPSSRPCSHTPSTPFHPPHRALLPLRTTSMESPTPSPRPAFDKTHGHVKAEALRLPSLRRTHTPNPRTPRTHIPRASMFGCACAKSRAVGDGDCASQSL